MPKEPNVDAELFSLTVIQVLIKRLVYLKIITAEDQQAIYLDAADAISQADKRALDTVNYCKFLAYAVDVESE